MQIGLSKLMRNKTLMRFTAFLLAFCCLFSMAPPAFAADDVEATAEGDSEYRYIWLISQPGFGIRITRGPNDQPHVQVSDMELAQYPLTGTPWMDCKLITSPTTGEQVYVLDGDKIPADADNTSWGTRPAATDGIGYLRMYTNFDNVVLPDTSIPNWEGTEFAYVNNQTRPFDPNQITADDGGKQYWAGNISGGDTFNIGKDHTSWSTMVDKKAKYAPISCDPEDDEYMPSPIDVQPVYDLNLDDTYYFAQVQIPVEVVNDYITMHDGNFMGEGTNTDSRFTVANNTMFQFRSINELPIPDISDIGTVIFDFNLPGTDAEVKYLRQAGTMVDVPPISTQDVQGVTFRFKGWFTEAEGGTQITDAQVEVPGGGYQVYYAQWELIDNGGGDGQIGEGDMYVAYFDYNIEGAGVTSAYCAAGEFTWSVTVDGETETYTAVLPFQFPEDPYRVGYKFLGWATTPQATSPDVDPDTWLPTKDDNTVYGVWEAQPYTLTWNANGGAPNTTTQQRYNEEIVPPNTEPTREGYTFGGWYLDRNCTVPLASGTKVAGNQVFYAKWTSERVVVNYYDTRQGTALVTTQEYNYGDKLNLLGPIEDTDGWHFQSWQTADGKEASSIVILDDSVLTYRKGGNGWDVSSDAGYWVLDLYALWGQDTAKFAATVRWDDFQNNDGCRPQSVKLGLVSSINDELVREATVTNDGNDTQTYTFTDLPITTSDSSVEKITYKLIFLGWTDSDGVYREIHDTEASSGEIEGSSGSDYDDTVSTVYKYAINNYVTGYAGYIKLDHNLITTGDDIAFRAIK